MATRRKIKADRFARAIIGVVAVILVVVVVVTIVMFVRLIRDGDFLGSGSVVVVPDVVGLSEDDASTLLNERNLNLKVQDRKYNDTQAKGIVFKQNPLAEAKVKEGRRVNLWVSLGPSNFTVPDLTGVHIINAEAKILESGLLVGSVRKIYSPDSPRGRIISQSPKAGAEYRSPVPVDVIVADQEDLPQILVPELIDMRLVQAEELLYDRNLPLSKVHYVVSETDRPGTVIGQNLAAGSSVQLGKNVELEVAMPRSILESRTKTMTVRIQVPPGLEKQPVRIKIFDALAPGGDNKYESQHKPGDIIEQQLDLEGDATIMIFIGNSEDPYRTEYLKRPSQQ